jgi:AraC-like DNA-binding protein
MLQPAKLSRAFFILQQMLFQFNRYSTLLLIFFVHLLVYAGMLFWRSRRESSLADRLLGFFLLLAALSVVPWMVGFAGWYDDPTGFYKELLFYIPFVHRLFFGPLLFLYVKSLTNFSFRIRGRDWLHFLPGALYLVWTITVVLVDKVIVGDYYLMNGENDPDFDAWYEWISMGSITCYLYLAIRYYRGYRKYSYLEFSFAELAGMGWLRNFLVAFGIITLLPVVEFIVSFFPFFQKLRYMGSWYYFFTFALVVYYIAINGYNAVRIPLRHLSFEPALLMQYKAPAQLAAPPVSVEDIPYEDLTTKPPALDIDSWKKQLDHLLTVDQLYKDPELTLTQLARKMQTNTSVLSKVVNQGYGMNFNDLINTFRVEAVIDMLRKKEHLRQTYLGIAFDCGFNSKATFNRAFKKHTGLNPRDWLEQNPV